MDYGISKKVDYGFDEARNLVEAELKKEGFGILTEINVKDTLKEKLDVDFRRYLILGACNPSFAHKALQQELEVGLLMPCNVIIYEDDDGNTVVSALDVETAMTGMVPNLKSLAEEIGSRLRSVIERL